MKLVGISLRKGNFWQFQNIKLILLLEAFPPGRPTGLCPCTPLGASAVPRPLACGGPGPLAPIAVYFLHISAYFKSYNIDSPDWPKNILMEICWTQNFYSIINLKCKGIICTFLSLLQLPPFVSDYSMCVLQSQFFHKTVSESQFFCKTKKCQSPDLFL